MRTVPLLLIGFGNVGQAVAELLLAKDAEIRLVHGLALQVVGIGTGSHGTALDPEGLLRICRSEHITMCGVVPSAVMLVAARALGAQQAELVNYATSGDVTGDNRQVVGYASVTVW